MKEQRLEDLYRRRLVPPGEGGRQFPIDHLLRREITYYPAKPAASEFDALEIGPGMGEFLLHLASSHPEWRIMGIELGRLRFEKIKKKLGQQNFSNVTLLHADARSPLAGELKHVFFKRVYVLFPDPWPRNCHRHRRLLNKDFLQVLSEHLLPGAVLQLATDVQDYAEWVLENISSNANFVLQDAPLIATSPPDDLIPTFFARKWQERGRPAFYLKAFRKIQEA